MRLLRRTFQPHRRGAKRTTSFQANGCWAHARRKFYDAREVNSEAFEVLNLIGDLYKLERRLKKASAGEYHSMRQLHAVPVLNDIFVWCWERREKFLPNP